MCRLPSRSGLRAARAWSALIHPCVVTGTLSFLFCIPAYLSTIAPLVILHLIMNQPLSCRPSTDMDSILQSLQCARVYRRGREALSMHMPRRGRWLPMLCKQIAVEANPDGIPPAYC